MTIIEQTNIKAEMAMNILGQKAKLSVYRNFPPIDTDVVKTHCMMASNAKSLPSSSLPHILVCIARMSAYIAPCGNDIMPPIHRDAGIDGCDIIIVPKESSILQLIAKSRYSTFLILLMM